MRPYPTLLLITALALLGYLLLPRLSVRWQPGTGSTHLRVMYTWPGAGPAALEQQVTAPLEAAFALVRDVGEITSVSGAGSGSINLRLRRDADADFVRFNVAAQVRRLYPELPAELSYPTIDFSGAAEGEEQSRLPVMAYSLSGPSSPAELYRYASEQLVPRLSLLRGLNRLEVTGGNRTHWRIALRPQSVATAGLSREVIAVHLREYLQRQGLGYLRLDGRKLYAYTDSPLGGIDQKEEGRRRAGAVSVADWSAIPLPGATNRQLRLGDVAEVSRVPLPPRSHYRINGKNSIRLLAYANDDANRLTLTTELGTRVRALQRELRPGHTFHLEEDTTVFLREELRKTRRRTALSLGILLFFVLLAYRSFRRLGMVLFSLAVNLGLAFLAYWLLGVELNLYAFAGIAVSFGIMIDNVIIVLDQLARRGNAGAVRAPVVGATLTTLASLSVIYFLSDELRLQLYELARVMALNLTTSVLVALVFVPALENLMPAGNKPQGTVSPPAGLPTRYERLLACLLRYRKTTLVAVVLAFGLPVWWLPQRIEGWKLYNETLGSDWYRDQLRPHVNKYLGGSFRLFSYYVYEDSGYRPAEETRLYVGAALPEGATLGQLNDVLLRVETYLGRFSGQVDRYTTRVTSGQYGLIVIAFPEGGRGSFPHILKNRLTAYATNFGGVKWNIYGVGQGYSNDSGGGRASYRITLKGYDQAGLNRQSDRFAALLLQHPRVQEVNTDANFRWWEKDRREYLLTPRNAALARRGFSATDLQSALAWFDRNDRPRFYLRDGTPVAITTHQPANYDRWQLENRSIPLDTAQLDFTEVATLEQRVAPQTLHKENQQYLRLVAFEYLGSPRFGNRHLEACLDTLKAEMPLGFTAERRSFSRDEQARELTALLGLAVLLIFFICALLFESLRQAFNIVLLIPISCIGIFLTFYWFQVRLDQGGYTSFLLVTGLAVNGLILVINEYNGLRKDHPGWSGPRLYATALHHKFTPILLTVLSTAVGLLPFLLGGRDEIFWHALAAGTIGGLVFSLLVIVFISPVFFLRSARSE